MLPFYTAVTLADWLLSDLRLPKGIHSQAEAKHAWWRVMCLTGVDYFSTLGYQPGIAFLAAGFLSPLATLILVLVTLFGALPVYSRVAEASPNGQGSIAMLENLFPRWTGKTFVLILLGFATTDFMITMTLSAADAAAHFNQNPYVPAGLKSQLGVTVALLAILGAIFLKGFKEAINVAVVLVATYLVLSGIITLAGIWQLTLHPEVFSHWQSGIRTEHSDPMVMIGVSLLLFPKLALGLSGFETGVAVMPLISGSDQHDRIRNTRKLLVTAAVIMSVFLIATSLVTTLLIAPAQFKEGGEANSRALAYLGHKYLGDGFGTVYDISTIAILAFAGASAMAGLLNLIPRYLPRFGMAPEWARAARPLVLVFTGLGFLITVLFKADVDAQGGAYATGVLVLITSAAIAVTLHSWRQSIRWAYLLIALVFVYTTLVNIHERPEGLKISSFFILAVVIISLTSRALRSTELRVSDVHMDATADSIIREQNGEVVRLLARRPRQETPQSLDEADRHLRRVHNIPDGESIVFLQIERSDASTFEETLQLCGQRIGKHCVLIGRSPVVANSIAATLIYLEHRTGQAPHAYFTWTEGNPIGNVFRFIFLGEGDVAPVVHEVLRRAIPDPHRRPFVHVG